MQVRVMPAERRVARPEYVWIGFVAALLTGVAALPVGLIVWIVVQLALLPETSVLQWLFLATGLVLGLVSLFWLLRTGQLRLW